MGRLRSKANRCCIMDVLTWSVDWKFYKLERLHKLEKLQRIHDPLHSRLRDRKYWETDLIRGVNRGMR